MSVVFCRLDESFNRGVTEHDYGVRDYELQWKVRVSDPNMCGAQVLQAVRQSPNVEDKVPKVGDAYSFLGYTDSSTRVKKLTCELIEPQDPLTWRVKAEYGVDEGELKLMRPSQYETNPLRWPAWHWVEFVWDDVVIERAWCLRNIWGEQRGPYYYTQNEPGPIINSAGQQTIDPITEQDCRIILSTTVYYPSALYAIALNKTFARTVHAPSSLSKNPAAMFDDTDVPFFMGFPHGTWKFVSAEAGKPQFRQVEGEATEIQYCETTIKLEYRRGMPFWFYPEGNDNFNPFQAYSGWIRLVLSNGQTCYRKWFDKFTGKEQWIADPSRPARFVVVPGGELVPKYRLRLPTTVKQVRSAKLVAYEDTREDPVTEPRSLKPDDLMEVETSEPMNLAVDGTQITEPDEAPIHIPYLTLKPENYYRIVDYFENPIYPQDIELPQF